MAYFLGIDAGGTKTEFVVGDETRELARVRTGTLQRLRTDAQTAKANLEEGLRRLTAASGVSMQSIERCCIGTSGETVPLVVDWLRQAFDGEVSGELIVVGDVEVALDSVFSGGRGVLVLAGTGSNVAARSAGGAIVTAGGWGPAMADQGSAQFLGREGLRRGFLAIDQQRPSRLLDAVMNCWNLGTIGELIEQANANPAPDFSRVAPLVADCAAQGDKVAQEVLEQGGADLAYLAGLLVERLRDLEANRGMPFELPVLAVAGSILARVAPVRRPMERALRERYAAIIFEQTPADPPRGALWRARQGKMPGGKRI
jgi:N-acetylglucosamine kinase-like BadF-type ATPase